MRCLDENTVLDLLSGGLPEAVAAEVDAHVVECAPCRELVVEALAARDASGATSGASSQWLSALGMRDADPPAAGSFVPGAVIEERYRLERKIGEGGMGLVWAATDLDSGTPVAIKQVKGLDEERAARAIREAGLANSVRHPGVVRMRDVIEQGSIVLPDGSRTRLEGPTLVMELLEGESLAQRLARQGRLSAEETSRIGAQIVDALVAVHAAGVVHRDLKPANVFLGPGPSPRIKLLDFGLAKRLRFSESVDASSRSAYLHLTRTGAMIGTPHYMAPEQIFGEDSVDARADAWALGVILHECLAGERPIRGDTFGRILKDITMGAPPSLESEADVPRDLARLVRDLMSKDPSARPRLDVARKVLGGRTVDAPSAPASWTRRRAIPIVALSGLTLGAIGLAMIGSRTSLGSPPIMSASATADVVVAEPSLSRTERTGPEEQESAVAAATQSHPAVRGSGPASAPSSEPSYEAARPRRTSSAAPSSVATASVSTSASPKKLPGGLEPMPPY